MVKNDFDNIAFERLCKQNGMAIKFDYMTPDMEQQNRKIDRKLAMI